MSTIAGGPAARAGRGRRPLRSSVLAAAGAALLALTACTPSAPPDAPQGIERERLTPSGDPGSWFLDSYSSGVARGYATSNTVCGVSGEVVVEVQDGPGPARRTLARNLVDGRVLWERDEAGCWEGSVFGDGVAAALQGGSSAPEWHLLDVRTGEPTLSLHIEDGAHGTRPVAEVDGVLVLQGSNGALLGFRGAEQVWSVASAGAGSATPLADGYIGVVGGPRDRAQIIDGRTGETVMERTLSEPFELTWASDGFVLEVNQSDPEYAFYDVRGEELDRTDGTPQYPFVPSPEDGVTFAVADHVAAGGVVGVDADGRPALFQDARQRDLTPDGEIEDLPDSIISLQGVSRSGSMLLFGEERSGASTGSPTERYVVIDTAGQELFDWTVPGTSSSARIEAGYIVIESEGTTQVLLPQT